MGMCIMFVTMIYAKMPIDSKKGYVSKECHYHQTWNQDWDNKSGLNVAMISDLYDCNILASFILVLN